MTRAIFWDNDGVLVDTEHLYYRATREVLATVGIDLTPEQYRELFLVQSRGAWHLAAERGLSPDRIQQLRDERHARFSRLVVEHPVAVAGAAEVLGALHGKYRMGVVTTSTRDHFDLVHRSTGFTRYFDFVITSEDVTRLKPDPEPYLVAIRRSGLAPHECIAVEDSERGLTAAHAAGIACVVVPSAMTRGGAFGHARQVLGSIRDVPTAL